MNIPLNFYCLHLEHGQGFLIELPIHRKEGLLFTQDFLLNGIGNPTILAVSCQNLADPLLRQWVYSSAGQGRRPSKSRRLKEQAPGLSQRADFFVLSYLHFLGPGRLRFSPTKGATDKPAKMSCIEFPCRAELAGLRRTVANIPAGP